MNPEDEISVTGYADIFTATNTNHAVGSTWYDSSTGSVNVNTGGGYLSIGSIGGGGGGAGQVLTTNNTGPYTIGQAGHVWANVLTDSTTINSALIIKHGGKELNVGEAITMLMDRLCIIEPSLHLHEKYPALKEAYDAYKAIEAMCKAGDTDE